MEPLLVHTEIVYAISVRTKIIFNVNESDAELARNEARSHTTLDELFRGWLKRIACRLRARKYRVLMDDLHYADAG